MNGVLENIAAQLAMLADNVLGRLPEIVVLVVATAFALLLHAFLQRVLTRLTASRELFWRSLVARAENPLRLSFVVAGLAIGVRVATIPDEVTSLLHHALLIGFILTVMRMAQLALHIFATLHLRYFKLGGGDEFLARKHITQSRILERVAGVLIIVFSVGAILMTFDPVRHYGVSLLASAGAAGIVVGLALQPMLKNLLAGIQLALTQPIRIDDILIVEGEYGTVEEITSTYVVVRVWDRRRLIIPLNYFIEQPFQNWTRDETQMIGIVFLYVDFSVPVEALRKKAEEVVRASPLWDGNTFSLQVTDWRDTTMELRILASAVDSSDVFGLKCEVREAMVSFLAEHYPGALPRHRAELEGAGVERDPTASQQNKGGRK